MKNSSPQTLIYTKTNPVSAKNQAVEIMLLPQQPLSSTPHTSQHHHHQPPNSGLPPDKERAYFVLYSNMKWSKNTETLESEKYGSYSPCFRGREQAWEEQVAPQRQQSSHLLFASFSSSLASPTPSSSLSLRLLAEYSNRANFKIQKQSGQELIKADLRKIFVLTCDLHTISGDLWSARSGSWSAFRKRQGPCTARHT